MERIMKIDPKTADGVYMEKDKPNLLTKDGVKYTMSGNLYIDPLTPKETVLAEALENIKTKPNPLQCKCEFIAKSKMGLRTHQRHCDVFKGE